MTPKPEFRVESITYNDGILIRYSWQPSREAAARVWRGLESTPGFNEELSQARHDLAQGKGMSWRDIRREPTGLRSMLRRLLRRS